MSARRDHADQVRRWAWVACALGAPAVLVGLWSTIDVLVGILLGGDPPRVALTLLFLLPLLLIPAAPALLGVRMIREAARVRSGVDGAELRVAGPDLLFPNPAKAVIRRAAATLGPTALVLGIALWFGHKAEESRTHAYVHAAQVSLEDLIRAQALYHAKTGRFSEDFGELGYAPLGGTSVDLITGGSGWTAQAKIDEPPLVGCAVFGGLMAEALSTPGGLRPSKPSQVLCDSLE